MESGNKFGLSKARVDQPAHNFSESQVATTYAGSMAGTHADGDDTRTYVSTFSYNSGTDAAKFLRQAYGRVCVLPSFPHAETDRKQDF